MSYNKTLQPPSGKYYWQYEEIKEINWNLEKEWAIENSPTIQKMIFKNQDLPLENIEIKSENLKRVIKTVHQEIEKQLLGQRE